jgi:wobble nucleotide-excising tRNase
LSIVEMPALPQEVDDVLRTTVDGLGAETEKLVRAHIANAHTREGWLSQGLPVVQGDRCPFCGQDVTGSALIAAFRGFFSQGYGALKEKVAALQQRVSSSFGAPILERLKAQLARNLELGQEWQPLVGDTWDRALDLGPFEAVRDLILSALRTKQTTPLEAQGPVLTAPPALAFEAFRVSVAAYNTAAGIYNSKISATKERARTGQLDTSLAELAVLRSKEARFQEPLATASEESKNHSNTRDALEREKAEAKAQLDGFAANVLSGSQASINRFLQKFGADFRIKKLERKYAGGTPSSSYFLEIDNVLVDLGDRKTQRSEPSFRNTLSAGDRSALALAFFLAQLEHDPELSRRVVVFDDPFTSQDRARRLCTQQEIRRAHQRAMQVIVLSHDEAFLADCCSEGLPPAVVKTLQLRKTITGPTLEEWDPSQPRGQALGDFQRLKNFLAEGGTGGASGLRDVARTIRPLLEAVLRARFLDKFTEGQWLGDMIQLLRDNHAALPEGLALPQELGEVNEYSKRYHHAQNPGADTEPIDEAELKTYVERAVLLAGGFW